VRMPTSRRRSDSESNRHWRRLRHRDPSVASANLAIGSMHFITKLECGTMGISIFRREVSDARDIHGDAQSINHLATARHIRPL
jgi:hypothetical protein